MSEGGNRSQQSDAVLEDELEKSDYSLSERGLRELFEYCESHSLSEEGLRELIARHGLMTGNQNRLSNYEFFDVLFYNRRVTEGIIRSLLEYFPDAIRSFDRWSPLHEVCRNKNVTLSFIQLIVDAAPDSVRRVDNDGWTPLHYLCKNNQVDDTAAMQVLKLLIDKHPAAVRHFEYDTGCLPIHLASGELSRESVSMLVNTYPESVRMPSGMLGELPLHYACSSGSLATVEYLYRQYPKAIETSGFHRGYYPIHAAIYSMKFRRNYATALEVVKFLLNCDPNQKLIQHRGKPLLQYACDEMTYDISNIDAGIQIIETIFDAHPEAIENNGFTSNIHRFHQQVQAFINSELVYVRQASDPRLMMTPDDNGRLPLHRALQNNARLGSIKLLVKGNPSALRFFDNNFALPLHIACQHDSASVVQYLLELDKITLRFVDIDNNTVLHYACRGAKHDTISMLLEKCDSVSKRNAQGKLPIDLLWESNEISDRGSLEYTESVFRLLQANPEMINQ